MNIRLMLGFERLRERERGSKLISSSTHLGGSAILELP